jgi:hypothetical protein
MVLRYIYRNPVKAESVKKVSDYVWSDYKGYIDNNSLTAKEFVLNVFHENKEEAIKDFDNFANKVKDDVFLEVKDETKISDDRGREIIKGVCKLTSATG